MLLQHYKEDGMHKWFEALNGTGIHAFIYGHTHGEKHDYSESLRIHFWLKLQYHTADSKWNFTEKWSDMTIGGVATKHCWYIPQDGSEGKAC
eukprot:jgi/Phyca11/132881/e_gw1.250.9.1